MGLSFQPTAGSEGMAMVGTFFVFAFFDPSTPLRMTIRAVSFRPTAGSGGIVTAGHENPFGILAMLGGFDPSTSLRMTSAFVCC
jgi:hypothetical protein